MYLLKFQHQFRESSDGNLQVEPKIQDWAAGRTSALDCAGEVIEADADGKHLSEGTQPFTWMCGLKHYNNKMATEVRGYT